MILFDELLEAKQPKVKIPIKHPGELEVPEGKHFWQLPLKHYINLVKKIGYARVAKALTNLKVWNKKKHPDIAQKADKILTSLKKQHAAGKI